VNRLYYGGALFDDGELLNRASTWLAVQPYRFYFPLVFKSGRP
jgi:hypothetical protein